MSENSFETRPQVESETTVVAPSEGGERNRTENEASQPSQLTRPLEESARLANEKESNNVLGVDYTVSKENGYRRS